MAGPHLRSHWSTAAKSSLSSAYYLKHLAFCRVMVFTRRSSSDAASATLPSTVDVPGGSAESSRIPNSAVFARAEQGETKLMDRLPRQCGAAIPLDRVTMASMHADESLDESCSISSQGSVEESIRAAVEARAYQQIPELLNTLKEFCQSQNPFMFLSTLLESHRVHIVDEILQSFISIRPRSRPHVAYSCLLSYILESQNPLPLALAVIQRMLRSGCLPNRQTHLLLSKAWVERRKRSQGVPSILLEMCSIGYSPDCGTCNYLILSLCKVDQFGEAVKVLQGMGKACCVPDLDSYGTLISEMTELRMTGEVVEMVKEMVSRHGLTPRKGTILKAVGAMRANREIWRAVDVIQFLESEGVHIEFEAYELVLEGSLDVHLFILAGKFAIRMTERGFIPYIKVRQRVVEGLVSIGELELASIVRQNFAEIGS